MRGGRGDFGNVVGLRRAQPLDLLQGSRMVGIEIENLLEPQEGGLRLAGIEQDGGVAEELFDLALALGLPPGMWGLLRKSHTKEDYNWWQPYISAIPILCYIVLRNALRVFRNYHSAVFAWLGRCSLETYVLQYHIWLAADTKGLLRLGLWDSGIETVVLTAVFFWVSWHTAEATHTLTRWIVGDTVGRPAQARKISDDEDVNGEKNSPYLLPKVKTEDVSSSSSSMDERASLGDSSSSGFLGRLSGSLKLRVCLILFIMWLGNIMYR